MPQSDKALFCQNAVPEKQFPLLNLYILITAFLQIIGEAFQIYYLHLLKPIPIILMILYLHKQNPKKRMIGILVQIGLCFSLIGDLFLMDQKNAQSLQIGTISFAISHLFNIIAFNSGQKIRDLPKKYVMLRNLLYLVIVMCAALNIYSLYYKFTSKIIFSVYTIVLALEAGSGLKRYEISNSQSFKWILFGVVSFSISDTIIGFSAFDGLKFPFIKAVIMITYYSAQFCFVHGIIHQIKFNNLVNKTQKK